VRVQNAVKTRFLDESPVVRDSTIELVGRFVLSKPELLSTYYEKIVDRISVRFISPYFLVYNIV
jgi:cohesin loading factor subunit SCC2